MNVFALCVSLTAANFTYQLFGADVANYWVALERSYFQIIALLFYACINFFEEI